MVKEHVLNCDSRRPTIASAQFICRFYSVLAVALFSCGLNYVGRRPDLFGDRILYQLNYISAIVNID